MQYKEIDIKFNPANQYKDILIAQLYNIDFDSFLEYEKGIKAYVKIDVFSEEKFNKIIKDISLNIDIEFKIINLENKNWNEKWEANFSPVFVGKKCVIRADFHLKSNDVEYDIVINPKMSFGTGHHETTHLMIEKMFDLNFYNKKVIDIGCGTSVLSILASKLKAQTITAIDTDIWAYNNSIENIDRNNVSNVNLINDNIYNIKHQQFDIILANINRNVILEDITTYATFVTEKSDVLLSGFLKEDTAEILKKSEQLGFELVDSKNKNKWQIIHLKYR